MKQEITPAQFKLLIRRTGNFKKLARMIYKEAVGGYTFINGNGQTVTARPDLNWMKLYLEYADLFSKETDIASEELMKRVGNLLTKTNNTVKTTNTTGIVAPTLAPDNNQLTDSSKVIHLHQS